MKNKIKSLFKNHYLKSIFKYIKKSDAAQL